MNWKKQLVTALGLILSLLAWSGARAQITPLGDSYVNTAAATTNYGAKTLLDVDGATQTTYIQFDLASIPSGASVSQATLKLYVNSVTTAGTFNVDYVNGAWTESTIDASNAPPVGGAIASGVSVTAADKNQYILIDVTSAVQAWLSGSETNNGLALVANSSFNATFDSKENTATSHPAELDIAYAGGDGTITGVTTASGSGLTGGGTSGTLDLSLTNACAANQILQWNGSAWACANAGTGTITGVTAGTDLTGGGTSGNVTLNLNTSALNSTYAQLAATNTFTGNQTVNGNLSATGFQIGSNLFDYGSATAMNAFLGFAGNTTMTGGSNTAAGYRALYFNTTGGSNTASGALALYSNTTGTSNTASGEQALWTNTTGSMNTASGYFALADNTTGQQNTANGYEALWYNQTGNYNTATGDQALYSNTTGYSNVATGVIALQANTTGGYNVGSGNRSLYENTTGNYNVGVGFYSGQTADGSNGTGSNDTAVGAGAAFGTGSITNATAIGSNAVVAESNAVVLGCIAGTNNCASNVNVGIGTATPAYTLDVRAAVNASAGNFVGFTAPSGSGENGGDGIYGTGGNGDPSSGGAGGAGVAGVGGIAACCGELGESAPGGSFTGGASGESDYDGGPGVVATGGASNGDGIDAYATGGGLAGDFQGNVLVNGSLSKSSGSFKIDHPLDPANKYLYHSFVESPDMMNVYNGNIVLDDNGEAVIQMPEWFGVLNRDFRYQLTCIGGFAPVYVAKEVSNNSFRIAGGKAGLKVSWQVTGIRQDAWANAHRIPIEEEKNARERGHYIHPELYGASEQQSVAWARHPATMKRMQETTARQLAASQGQATTTRAETLPLAVPPSLKNTKPPALPAPVVRPGPAQKQTAPQK